jgi:hypothetical protein
VIQKGDRSWSFLGKVPYSDREIRHWVIFAIITIAVIGWNGSGGGATVSNPAAVAASPPTSYSTDSTTASGNTAYESPDSGTAWYASEKRHVEDLETAVKALDSELAVSETSINEMRSQIDAAENQATSSDLSTAYYRHLIDQHNAAARKHNAILNRRRTAYASYEEALDAFNRHIDAYNASHAR